MFLKVIKSKRFVATAVIVIFTCSALFWITTSSSSPFSFFIPKDEAKNEQNSLSPSRNNNGIDKDYYLRGSAALNETAYAEGKQLSVKNARYLCGTPFPSSTQYMEEYSIPLTCSQPVGITVDSNDKIWFVATWSGYLVVFDPDLRQFVDFFEIPNWKTKGTFGSMVWSMEFDKGGNLWFTDQVNDAIWRYFVNEKKFEMYKVPTIGSYPQGLSIDNKGMIWFTEIFGKRIGVLDPSNVIDNTTHGITEYPFEDFEYETMGPGLISNNNNNTIWFTTVTYPEGGNIVSFDVVSKNFTVFDLPEGSGVPVGMAEDDEGVLWINDHATNLFFRFDPKTSQITKYSTSLPTSRNDTTTLPYWNIARDGKIWFNEHEGNAIAYFDIMNSTLVEYQIPTKGTLWGNTSNPLKFTMDKEGSVWFTEWTENKIGVLQSNKITDLPLWLTLSKNRITLDTSSGTGDKLMIHIYPNSTYFREQNKNYKPLHDVPVKITVATSITPSGKLWNISTNLDNDTIYFENDNMTSTKNYDISPNSIGMEINPIKGLFPGNYTLTIGARYDSVSYSKIIDLVVTE
ncbi:MAG: virginiamycin B lyase family protein [Nitrososphaeraceae archaeon]